MLPATGQGLVLMTNSDTGGQIFKSVNAAVCSLSLAGRMRLAQAAVSAGTSSATIDRPADARSSMR